MPCYRVTMVGLSNLTVSQDNGISTVNLPCSSVFFSNLFRIQSARTMRAAGIVLPLVKDEASLVSVKETLC